MIRYENQCVSCGFPCRYEACRCGERLQEAVEWCRQYDLEFDAVNENLPEMIEWFGDDTRKVCADVYIDDKAVNKPKYHVPYREVVE